VTAEAQSVVPDVIVGTGRRKTAIARVRMKRGEGRILVNQREYKSFFATEKDRQRVVAPLVATGTASQFDVFARVNGGGTTGQSGAIMMGIARALKKLDPGLDDKLRAEGFLTRDARMKERKKYGQRGARRSFQFSKR
jgi:small subunit ribosomal protein S9